MYKILDKIALADMAFTVEDRDLNVLFAEAAEVLFSTMADISSIQPVKHKEIILEADKADQLFYDWLAELIYIKDKDYLLFSKFRVDLSQNGKFILRADAWGEEINQARHPLKADIKAVTYHLFYLKKIDKVWKARVVLDI